jgi:hypothetical protein
MARLEPELVNHALKVARQHGFAEVEVEVGDAAFRAKLEAGEVTPYEALRRWSGA